MLIVYGKSAKTIETNGLSIEDIIFICEDIYKNNSLEELNSFLFQIVHILSFGEINTFAYKIFERNVDSREYIEELLLSEPISSIIELKIKALRI